MGRSRSDAEITPGMAPAQVAALAAGAERALAGLKVAAR